MRPGDDRTADYGGIAINDRTRTYSARYHLDDHSVYLVTDDDKHHFAGACYDDDCARDHIDVDVYCTPHLHLVDNATTP